MTIKANVVRLESKQVERYEGGCSHCLRRPLCLASFVAKKDLLEFDGLIQHGRPVRRGHTIVRSGDPVDRLYIVRSGTFKSYRLHKSGVLHVTGFYLPGDLMGLDDMHMAIHSDYIESLEVGSVCELPMATIEKIMATYPKMITQLLGSISALIHREKNMMFLLGNMDAEQKVASFLLDLSARSHRSGFSGDSIELSMIRSDIANYLGMAVETISRVLQRLRDRGILQVDYRSLRILDSDRLERLITPNVDLTG